MKEDKALELELDSLASELSIRYEELNLLYRVGDKLKIAEDLHSTLKDIIKEFSNIFHGNTIILSVPDKEIFESVSGEVKYTNDKMVNIANKISESCNYERSHIAINNLSELKNIGFNDIDWFKFIATSVKIKDEYKGVLIVLGNKERDYSTGDIKLLTVLAGQLSIIITNSDLYLDLKNFLLNLVKSMVYAIEAKDSYTRGHSERVHNISVLIAKVIRLSQTDIENVSWAALLHDIGKIGIPEQVLTKPGRLADEEYELIMTHPKRGYEILKPIIQLKDALQGILYHQERYDGTGYPEHLKGEDIPLYARIIALADTYDSITSSRAYRTRNTHQNAMDEIERVSGTQLDPLVVEAFKKVLYEYPDIVTGEQLPHENKEN